MTPYMQWNDAETKASVLYTIRNILMFLVASCSSLIFHRAISIPLGPVYHKQVFWTETLIWGNDYPRDLLSLPETVIFYAIMGMDITGTIAILMLTYYYITNNPPPDRKPLQIY